MPPPSSGLPGWQREEHSSTECLEITQLLELEDSLVFDSKIQDSNNFKNFPKSNSVYSRKSQV